MQRLVDDPEHLLPRDGTLIAWTTQGFPPGAPYAGPTGDDFVPSGWAWSNSGTRSESRAG